MKHEPGPLTLSEDDRRVLALWAADCAERTLSLLEAQAPSDSRPRGAIDGVRAFASGEMRIGKVRALAARAHAAAREIGDPIAGGRGSGGRSRCGRRPHGGPCARRCLCCEGRWAGHAS
jgi:hypothetical protein